MKSVASSASLFCLAGLTALGSCSNANVPTGLSLLGSPQLLLEARFPLSSWQCGKTPYVTFKPGQILQSSDTENAPVFNPNSGLFTTSFTNNTGKYVFLMVDPNTNTTDSYYPALHTLYANVTVSNGNLDWVVLAPFLNPMPNTVAPHNYTMLLFEQPEEQFVIPSKFSSFLPLNLSDIYARVNFPILDFVLDTGLGEPVAGNWFREGLSRGNGTSSSTTPSARLCSMTTLTSSASSTGIVRNTTATVTATGTGTGIATSSAGTSATSTKINTSPAIAGKAASYRAGVVNVLLGLGAAIVGTSGMF